MPRLTDRPLDEACANGDGTYDGRKMVRWLFEATTGKPLSEAEAQDIVEKAEARAAARRNVRPPGA